MSLLQRHYDPTEGSILLDDTQLMDIDAGWYREQLGVVSQDPRLFSESISENIAYGKEGLTQASAPLLQLSIHNQSSRRDVTTLQLPHVTPGLQGRARD